MSAAQVTTTEVSATQMTATQVSAAQMATAAAPLDSPPAPLDAELAHVIPSKEFRCLSWYFVPLQL